MKAILMSWGGMVAVGLLAASGTAFACTNDIDCPDPSCGGEVCSWATATHTCVAAGTDQGWCSVDTDCKCHAEGATCVGVHCSFTVPQSSTTGGTSTGGGTTGASTSGGGTTIGGATTGGTTTAAGTTGGGSTTGAGTTGGAASGGTTTTGGAYSSSGCSTTGGGTSLVLGLGLLAGLALLRRRP